MFAITQTEYYMRIVHHAAGIANGLFTVAILAALGYALWSKMYRYFL